MSGTSLSSADQQSWAAVNLVVHSSSCIHGTTEQTCLLACRVRQHGPRMYRQPDGSMAPELPDRQPHTVVRGTARHHNLTCQPQQLCASVALLMHVWLYRNRTPPTPLTVLLAWLQCTLRTPHVVCVVPITPEWPYDTKKCEVKFVVCLLQANRCKWHGLVQHCRQAPGVNLHLERTGTHTPHRQTCRLPEQHKHMMCGDEMQRAVADCMD